MSNSRAGRVSWERLNRLRKQRRFQNAATLGLVGLGPVLAVATFLILNVFDPGASAFSLRAILLADLVYVLAIAALVLQRVARMVAARRAARGDAPIALADASGAGRLVSAVIGEDARGRILFVHTGGVFSLFGRSEELLSG